MISEFFSWFQNLFLLFWWESLDKITWLFSLIMKMKAGKLCSLGYKNVTIYFKVHYIIDKILSEGQRPKLIGFKHVGKRLWHDIVGGKDNEIFFNSTKLLSFWHNKGVGLTSHQKPFLFMSQPTTTYLCQIKPKHVRYQVHWLLSFHVLRNLTRMMT